LARVWLRKGSVSEEGRGGGTLYFDSWGGERVKVQSGEVDTEFETGLARKGRRGLLDLYERKESRGTLEMFRRETA